jgi:hypothetical protein
MREALAAKTLSDLAARTAAKAPRGYADEIVAWMQARE